MRATVIKAFGGVDQFSTQDVPGPVPGTGEVLIRVAASGLNPVDTYVRQGYLQERSPMTMPAILGVDAAGTVVALGSGVTGYAVGDRVIGHLPINGKGGHAELAIVPIAGLAKLPANVDFAAGATLPLAGLTGWQAGAATGSKSGDRVLVSGALGAVGRAAVQYLKSIGAAPVAAVRASRLAEGRALAGEALDIDAPVAAADFYFAVSAAAPAATNLFAHVRDSGIVASAVQVPEGINPNDRVRVASLWTHDDPKMLQAIADAAGRGELTIPIAATFSLQDLAAAHTKLVEPHLGGKIIIVP